MSTLKANTVIQMPTRKVTVAIHSDSISPSAKLSTMIYIRLIVVMAIKHPINDITPLAYRGLRGISK